MECNQFWHHNQYIPSNLPGGAEIVTGKDLEFGKESEKDTVCSRSKLEADEDKYLKDCSLDTCQRSHNTALDIHAVTMICTTKDLCEASKKACKEKGDDKCAVACCSTDKCNVGSYVTSNVFVMLVCCVVGLALRK